MVGDRKRKDGGDLLIKYTVSATSKAWRVKPTVALEHEVTCHISTMSCMLVRFV